MATLTITWNDYNIGEDGFNIYRSEAPMDTNDMPSPIATVGSNIGSYDDQTVIEKRTYYYRVGVIRGQNEIISDEYQTSTIEYSPGPMVLIAGDFTDGFFGETPSEELITGQGIIDQIGSFYGADINEGSPWLKFVHKGKILYIAKKPLKRGLSWNDINSVGAARGGATITINGLNYIVRLMSVFNEETFQNTLDPTDQSENYLIFRKIMGVHGSEWFNYTQQDLQYYLSGAGYNCWGIEMSNDGSEASYTATNSGTGATARNYRAATFSWRPVLELVR